MEKFYYVMYREDYDWRTLAIAFGSTIAINRRMDALCIEGSYDDDFYDEDQVFEAPPVPL